MEIEVDVVKGINAIEELKVDLLEAQWLLHHGMAVNSEVEILRSLADTVGLCYLLARRVGLDYSVLDRTLIERLTQWQNAEKENLEKWWGDISLLRNYLEPED